jgi:hypothetical protein
MKLSELALKTECVKNYGAVSRSPEMQAIFQNTIRQLKLNAIAQEKYRERVEVLQDALWQREKAGEKNLYIDYSTMTIEVL